MAKPVEQESLKVPFFALSVLMLLIASWSLLDEFVLRRDWKVYQREFKMLELDRAARELEETRKALIHGEFPESWPEEEIEKAKQFPPLAEIEKELAAAWGKVDRGRLSKIESSITAAQRREYLANIEFQNAKSEDLEWWYHFTHALDLGDAKGLEHARKRLDEIAAAIERTGGILRDIRAELEKLAAERAEIMSDVDKWQQMHVRVSDRIGEVQSRYDRIHRRSKGAFWWFFGDDDVVQYVIRGTRLNEFNEQQYAVDRCSTCHYAIDKLGWEKEEKKLFRSHPHMEAIFGDHPPEQFGCTSCHQGQGYALEPVDEAHGTIHYWDWPLLGRKRLPDGYHYDSHYDPTMVQSSCVKCHKTELQVASRAPDPWTGIPYQKYIDYAQELNNGRESFEKLGCWGCHQAKGFEVLDELGHKPGPSLTRIQAKTTPEWLYAWIKDPHKILPKTRMPYFQDYGADPASPDYEEQREHEIKSLVAFIWSRADDAYPARNSDNRAESWFTAGSAGKGEKLFDSIGCKACHVATSDFANARPAGYYDRDSPFYKEFDSAPNLYTVGSKVNAKWLYHWLKNPSGYSHETAMPSLRLSDDEARDITTFLMGKREMEFPAVDGLAEALSNEEMIAKGEWIVRNYGCFGCHTIKGFENEQKVAPELTEFALKGAHELAFGPATQVERTWESWFLGKVQNPRGYRDERNLQKMPQFGYNLETGEHGFTDDQAHRLMVLVKGFTNIRVTGQWQAGGTARQQAIDEGQRLVEYYNCKACHIVDRRGGRVLGYYEDNQRLGPPDLTFLGAKVQADWLTRFLLNPFEVRPWLEIRMPTFGWQEGEHFKVVNYFSGVAGDLANLTPTEVGPLDPASVALGKQVFERNACTSCHQVNPKIVKGQVGQLAPDLRIAWEKLKPDWVQRFARNPMHMYPGIVMPSFWSFPQTEDGLTIYDPARASPDEAEQIIQNWKEIKGVSDWLLVYGREAQVKGAVGSTFNANLAAARAGKLPPAAYQPVTGIPGQEPSYGPSGEAGGDEGGDDGFGF